MMDVKSGLRRKAFIFKRFVIKVPRNRQGFKANWQEFLISLSDKEHYAKVYLFFFGIIVVEKLSVLDVHEVNLYLRFNRPLRKHIDLKEQLDEIKKYVIEEYQIGISKDGKLKYYDYERKNELKRR